MEFIKKTNKKIGLSKFCQLRPKWCVTMDSATGIHNVCVCEILQIAKLSVDALPQDISYMQLLTKLLCNITNRDCMLHNCDDCTGEKNLGAYLDSLFNEAVECGEGYDEVCYHQWHKVEKGISLFEMMPSQEIISNIAISKIAKLSVDALPQDISYMQLLTKLLCNITNRDCMLHNCDDCTGEKNLGAYLDSLFNEAVECGEGYDEVCYHQWHKVEKGISLFEMMPSQEIISNIAEALKKLCPHHFIAKAQAAFL